MTPHSPSAGREAGAANNGPATAGPTDADLDDMHHALGRPDGPHVEPYRNRFCCGVDSPNAKRFDAMPSHWRREYLINDGRDALYAVTAEGRRQVWLWIAEKNRAAGLRAWLVSGEDISTRTVMARSRAAARTMLYRHLADVWSISFRDFLRLDVRVRLA